MKEIKAYVHSTHISAVITAIKDSPAWGGAAGAKRHNLATYIVKGSLVPMDGSERHYSMDLGDEVVNEYKLELICEDGDVDALVDAVVAAARTGQSVAGWVTVTDLVRAVPIH